MLSFSHPSRAERAFDQGAGLYLNDVPVLVLYEMEKHVDIERHLTHEAKEAPPPPSPQAKVKDEMIEIVPLPLPKASATVKEEIIVLDSDEDAVPVAGGGDRAAGGQKRLRARTPSAASTVSVASSFAEGGRIRVRRDFASVTPPTPNICIASPPSKRVSLSSSLAAATAADNALTPPPPPGASAPVMPPFMPPPPFEPSAAALLPVEDLRKEFAEFLVKQEMLDDCATSASASAVAAERAGEMNRAFLASGVTLAYLKHALEHSEGRGEELFALLKQRMEPSRYFSLQTLCNRIKEFLAKK